MFTRKPHPLHFHRHVDRLYAIFHFLPQRPGPSGVYKLLITKISSPRRCILAAGRSTIWPISPRDGGRYPQGPERAWTHGGIRKIAARFGVDPGTVQRISRPFE